MNKDNLVTILLICVLFLGFFIYLDRNGRYSFHFASEESSTPSVFVGDTQTGRSWNCISSEIYEQGKNSGTWKKNFTGCIEFIKP